ncbi:hypothetical protein [Thermococcus sp.]|uniref:hypothetical protein n=1 Tax=Thermococcus sp. TaxID=35749 RepID=UPI00263519CE|nr:hypothetical protein [Thermococcus sp.]
MPLLISYFKLEKLKDLSLALEKVEELRTLIPVEVANIQLEDKTIKLVLHVPASSLALVRRAFPEGIVLS